MYGDLGPQVPALIAVFEVSQGRRSSRSYPLCTLEAFEAPWKSRRRRRISRYIPGSRVKPRGDHSRGAGFYRGDLGQAHDRGRRKPATRRSDTTTSPGQPRFSWLSGDLKDVAMVMHHRYGLDRGIVRPNRANRHPTPRLPRHGRVMPPAHRD
jgi:hypothetical protein